MGVIDTYAALESVIPPYSTLTVNRIGHGSVTLNPDQATYTAGTKVELTAVPDADWTFTRWSGDLGGMDNPETIIMNADKTVTATFASPPPTDASFDFGTSGSPVELGYTQVSSSTAYSPSIGYGWSSTAGLSSRDRGAPDDLRRDFVFSSTERTFNLDLVNGDYQITVIVGDQSFMHDQIDVSAESILAISDLTAAAGSFQAVPLAVTVSDGQLSLRILDDG